jgi:hypothetical protein
VVLVLLAYSAYMTGLRLLDLGFDDGLNLGYDAGYTQGHEEGRLEACMVNPV